MIGLTVSQKAHNAAQNMENFISSQETDNKEISVQGSGTHYCHYLNLSWRLGIKVQKMELSFRRVKRITFIVAKIVPGRMKSWVAMHDVLNIH